MKHNKLNEIIDNISSADSIDRVQQNCLNFCHYFGFDYYSYTALIPTSLTHPTILYFDNYPDELKKVYTEQNLFAVDPTVKHCMVSSVPLNWEVFTFPESHEAEKEFMEKVAGFGINSGTSIPVHTAQGIRSLLSLASEIEYPAANALVKKNKSYAQLFAVYLNEAMIRVHGISHLLVCDAPISDREKECLLWVAEGKTAWETGQILKIAERTVNFHINNVSAKLGAVNRQQAVARAITLGVIVPAMRFKPGGHQNR